MQDIINNPEHYGALRVRLLPRKRSKIHSKSWQKEPRQNNRRFRKGAKLFKPPYY